MFLGTGHRHVAETPLLLHLLFFAHGAVAGKQPVFHAHHVNVRKFQTLGGVHGQQRHHIVAVVGIVQIGVESNLVQEACQRGILRLVLQKALDTGGQLLHVFDASLTLHIVLLHQGAHVSGAVADIFVKLHQSHGRNPAAHFLHNVCKGHQLAGGILQFRVLRGMAQHLIEGQSPGSCQLLGLVHGDVADLPGGHVDNATQTQVIGGVVDETQIGQHILDLGAVEEFHAAHHTVRHTVALEGIFQCVGLGVHAVQHGAVPPVGAPVVRHHNLAHHEVGLVTFVEGGFDQNLIPRSVLRPQRLALAAHVVADHLVGSVQDILGRAVILLQADDTGTLILRLKAENVFNIGTPETVDALVIVSHHADVAVSSGQKAGQQILEMVGVLVFVDQHIAELALVVFPGRFVTLQQANRVQNDVIEVQCIGILQLFGVKFIYFTNTDSTPVPVVLRLLRELFRSHHLILGRGHDRQDLPDGKCFLIQAQILQNRLDDALAVIGIVDGEIPGEAQLVNVPAQDTHTGRVEGGCPDIPGLLPQHPLQTLLQLIGSLVGKGDGQHLPWSCRLYGAQVLDQRTLGLRGLVDVLLQEFHLILRNRQRDLIAIAAPAVTQQVGNPVDEHRGLAAAGTCQQQQRSLRCQHALSLFLIQMGVVRRNGTLARLYKPFLQIVHRSLSVSLIWSYSNTDRLFGQPPNIIIRIFVLFST